MKIVLVLCMPFFILSALACEVKNDKPILNEKAVVQEAVIDSDINKKDAVVKDKLETEEAEIKEPVAKPSAQTSKVIEVKETSTPVEVVKQTSKQVKEKNKEQNLDAKPIKAADRKVNKEPETDSKPKESELSFVPENTIPSEHSQVVEEVASGSEAEKEETKEPLKQNTWMHKDFDDLLKKYVTKAGKVNYKGLSGVSDKLDGYLSMLSRTDISSLGKNEKLVFWINAYNAFTIKKILDNYPLASITDLDGGKPWDVKWIDLDGRQLSLNNIENDIIRPQFSEPRIHFAVNCAAKSCPPLMNRAWKASTLEADLTTQTKAFLSDGSYNTITSSSAAISKIFEWYAEDFSDLGAFLSKYSTFQGSSSDITYKEYNWSLNE